MKLIYQRTGKEVKIGDAVVTSDNHSVNVAGFNKPHKPSSSGKVFIKHGGLDPYNQEVYVSCIGAAWVDREDQVPENPITKDEDPIKSISKAWNDRVLALEYKVGSRAYQKALIEFLVGVLVTSRALGNQEVYNWVGLQANMVCIRPNWTI